MSIAKPLEPELCHEHPGWPYIHSSDGAYRYCPPYFNFGVVCAPAEFMTRIGKLYFPYVLKIFELTDDILVTQMALAVTIAKLGLRSKALPVRYNFPNHPMFEALHGAEMASAKFLHLKEFHQIHKFKLFDDLAHVHQAIRRDDLRGINQIAQRVLAAIEPELESASQELEGLMPSQTNKQAAIDGTMFGCRRIA